MIQNIKEKEKERECRVLCKLQTPPEIMCKLPISGEHHKILDFHQLNVNIKIECNLELKKLNDCIKKNKLDRINKIDCHKLFDDYIKCNELIKFEKYIENSTK